MAAVPPPRPSNKHDILRAVYEDNLRVADPKPAPRPSHRRPQPNQQESRRTSRVLPVVLSLALVVAALAGAIVQGLGTEDAALRAPGPSAAGSTIGPPLVGLRSPDVLAARLGSESREAVPMAELFNLQVNTIVLDPGHGGRDPGTLGATGMTEKDITLDVALRLRHRLEAHSGYRILLTRDSDEAVALRDRVAFANENGADLFVSLHVNWIPDASVAPLETYYFGLRTDDETLQLAHGENAAADYSVAEFNSLLQQAGNTVKFQESKNLAGAVQRSLVRNVRETNDEASDWGVKAGPFVVLLGVESPAVLAEMAAISNPDEEARLGTDAHREDLARSLEEGIIAYLQERPTSPSPTATSPTTTPYGSEEN